MLFVNTNLNNILFNPRGIVNFVNYYSTKSKIDYYFKYEIDRQWFVNRDVFSQERYFTGNRIGHYKHTSIYSVFADMMMQWPRSICWMVFVERGFYIQFPNVSNKLWYFFILTQKLLPTVDRKLFPIVSVNISSPSSSLFLYKLFLLTDVFGFRYNHHSWYSTKTKGFWKVVFNLQ